MRVFTHLLLLAFLVSSSWAVGQITNIQVQMLPDGSVPGEQQDTINSWVLDFLHGGGGMIDTASITYTGNFAQIGRYWRGDDISVYCGSGYEGCMDEGLILSTGSVEGTGDYDPGNGAESDAFEFPPGNGGDPDLHSMYQMLGYEFFQVGDAATISFNYTPYGDEITMQYVFASEEYPNNISKDDVDLTDGSQMHDLFGIWVDMTPLPPPPYNDRFNAAIFPQFWGLIQPDNWVTLSNVNQNVRPAYYLQNEDAFPNTPMGTQYDGMTKPAVEFRLRKEVQRCKEYNIKVAIEDFVYNDPNTGDPSFGINSAVLLARASLIGGKNDPSWKVDTVWETNHQSHEGKLIEGGCTSLLLTVTLDFPFTDPVYDVGFAMYNYRDLVEVRYTDDYGGAVIPADDDFVRFENGGSLTKSIRITAKSIDTDLENVLFSFQTDPCDEKNPFTALYSGIMEFDMINNEPFSFDVNPKVYSGYCKETIEVTALDITNGGVEPKYYLWPEVSVPPVDYYFHTINNNPDFITVEVKDYCDNDTTMEIRFNNKPIQLVDIPTIAFCKPGMEQEVEVFPDMNVHNFPGLRIRQCRLDQPGLYTAASSLDPEIHLRLFTTTTSSKTFTSCRIRSYRRLRTDYHKRYR